MTEMVFRTDSLMPMPVFCSSQVSFSAKLSDANAAPRNPERVIATWMVARNPEEFRTIFSSHPARLFPLSTSFSNLVSFTEITAISVPANMAFSAIKAICSKIRPIIIYGFSNLSF